MSNHRSWITSMEDHGPRGRAVGSVVRAVFDIEDRRVLVALLGPAVRGFLLQRGKSGGRALVRSDHPATFSWSYETELEPLTRLYDKALRSQWNAKGDLPWDTAVDLDAPDLGLVPDDFIDLALLEQHGVKLTAAEAVRFRRDVAVWLLSQFLHGEQAALIASAQVTESIGDHGARLYGATQVLDEARHVEVFHRYLETKLEKRYPINDNLFTIADALVGDPRWDMKFLGMQIMVEGLALGAFGMLHQLTREPLLKQLLRYVIRDEARHVHFGVLTLREHFTKQITERERSEREDWALEVGLLMRDRFLAAEVFEEWFEGRIKWRVWRQVVEQSRGLRTFRQTMFRRLVPNLREIGLLSDRVRGRYAAAGLMEYASGSAATQLDEAAPLGEPEHAVAS